MSRKTVVVVAVLAAAVLLGGLLAVRALAFDERAAAPPTAVDTGDPSFFGVFEGRVPCAGCERVKVRLVLRQNPATSEPTTYVLEQINVGQGDERHTTSGRWTITRGTKADPRAAVYRLGARAPEGFRLYQVADDNILLFLDDGMRLKVGDAGHSYTLSRTS
ncbi:MAG: hypothetical protein GEV10_00825 [Streptosporangiales bacterium]|nr:hypothetical protein [Streptosporangiales bacterium]